MRTSCSRNLVVEPIVRCEMFDAAMNDRRQTRTQAVTLEGSLANKQDLTPT
jgi:hypothetical protein